MENTPRKIAHITTIDLSLRYLLLNQLRSIQWAGYTVTGISSPGPDVSSIEETGIRHIAVPMTRKMNPIADLYSLWRLYRVLVAENFLIVHTHNPKPGLFGQLAARLARVPIVVNTLHGFYFHDNTHPIWRRIYITAEKLAAWNSDIILSQNGEDILTAVSEGICKEEKIKYLGNGIDIRRFQKDEIKDKNQSQISIDLKLDRERPVIGFVGRLVEEKGLLDLLRATRLVLAEFPDTQFLIIGPKDPEKPDALDESVMVEYGKHCIFTGHRNDMPELYSLMDVFVLPSYREGFPRSPMEASAMGVPCIVSDIRGCREAVEHGRNGFLVPIGDVDTLADAVIELLSDKEKAQRMGEEGRRIAEERFDEQLVFAKVKAEYARLLHEKGLPVPGEEHTQPVAG